MEKYRKFADQTNGINPFINAARIKKQTTIMLIISFIMYFVTIIKAILFSIFLIIYVILHDLKKLFYFDCFVRLIEISINKLFCLVFLGLLGVYSFNEDNNYIKTSNLLNHSLNNNYKNNKKTIMLSSQSNLIDWLILVYNHSPKILYLIKSSKELSKNKETSVDILVQLSYLDIFTFGAGIKIDTIDNDTTLNQINQNELKYFNGRKVFDLTKELSNQKQSNIPILIFPEGTKTTREACLNIRSSVMNNLYDNLLKNKCDIFCFVTIYKYDYFCPNNTTDTKGLKNLILTMSQLYNKVKLQGVKINANNFDVERVDRSLVQKYKNKYYYYDSLIQEILTYSEFRNNIVNLNCLDHIEFLEFYNLANSSTNYVKDKKE